MPIVILEIFSYNVFVDVKVVIVKVVIVKVVIVKVK